MVVGALIASLRERNQGNLEQFRLRVFYDKGRKSFEREEISTFLETALQKSYEKSTVTWPADEKIIPSLPLEGQVCELHWDAEGKFRKKEEKDPAQVFEIKPEVFVDLYYPENALKSKKASLQEQIDEIKMLSMSVNDDGMKSDEISTLGQLLEKEDLSSSIVKMQKHIKTQSSLIDDTSLQTVESLRVLIAEKKAQVEGLRPEEVASNAPQFFHDLKLLEGLLKLRLLHDELKELNYRPEGRSVFEMMSNNSNLPQVIAGLEDRLRSLRSEKEEILSGDARRLSPFALFSKGEEINLETINQKISEKVTSIQQTEDFKLPEGVNLAERTSFEAYYSKLQGESASSTKVLTDEYQKIEEFVETNKSHFSGVLSREKQLGGADVILINPTIGSIDTALTASSGEKKTKLQELKNMLAAQKEMLEEDEKKFPGVQLTTLRKIGDYHKLAHLISEEETYQKRIGEARQQFDNLVEQSVTGDSGLTAKREEILRREELIKKLEENEALTSHEAVELAEMIAQGKADELKKELENYNSGILSSVNQLSESIQQAFTDYIRSNSFNGHLREQLEKELADLNLSLDQFTTLTNNVSQAIYAHYDFVLSGDYEINKGDELMRDLDSRLEKAINLALPDLKDNRRINKLIDLVAQMPNTEDNPMTGVGVFSILRTLMKSDENWSIKIQEIQAELGQTNQKITAAETLAKNAQSEVTQAKAEASTAHKEAHKLEKTIEDLTTKVTAATNDAKKAIQLAIGGLIAAIIGIFTPFLAVMGQQRPSALQGNGSQNNNFNLNLPTVNATGSNSSSQGTQPQGT